MVVYYQISDSRRCKKSRECEKVWYVQYLLMLSGWKLGFECCCGRFREGLLEVSVTAETTL